MQEKIPHELLVKLLTQQLMAESSDDYQYALDLMISQNDFSAGLKAFQKLTKEGKINSKAKTDLIKALGKIKRPSKKEGFVI